VRLASRLCGWDIEIKTRAEYEAELLGTEAPTSGRAADEADDADEDTSAGSTSVPIGDQNEGGPRH